MRRKLIPQGIGGYTIYLPKKWVTKKGLQNNDSVEVIETGPDLVVRAQKQVQKAMTLNMEGAPGEWDLRVLLLHAYRKDYERITITAEKELDLALIGDIVNRLLLGFAITEKSEERVVMENISEPEGEKYDAILRRIFLLNKEAISELKQDASHAFEPIKDYRDQADKYVLFCKRILYKERYHHDPLLHWELLTFLMHINHAIYYLARHLEGRPGTRDVAEMISSLDDYHQLLYDAYYKRDYSYVKRINDLRDDYQFGHIASLIEKGCEDPLAMAYLREVFRLVQISTSPIVALFMEEVYDDYG